MRTRHHIIRQPDAFQGRFCSRGWTRDHFAPAEVFVFGGSAGGRSSGSSSSGKSVSKAWKTGDGVSILSLSPAWFCSLEGWLTSCFGSRRMMLLELEGPSESSVSAANDLFLEPF